MSPTDPPPGDPPIVHPLDYAPRPPGNRWSRRLAQIATFSAIGVICIVGGKWAVRQATVLYWQRQCLNYVNTGQPINFQATSSVPESLWWAFNNANDRDPSVPATGNTSFCIFLGRMKQPNGVEKIVYVSMFPAQVGLPQHAAYNIWYGVVQPASLTERANLGFVSGCSGYFDPPTMLLSNPPAVDTAVLDPKDPSHFTFNEHHSDGTTLILSGRLDNNGYLGIAPGR